MKNRRWNLIITWQAALSCLFLLGWTYTLKTNTPAGGDDPTEADDRMRETKAAFVERFGIDHYIPASATSTYDATDAGKHMYVTFREPNDLTSMAADESALFSKDVSSVTELHWIDESDNVLQMTSGGDLYSSAGLSIVSDFAVNTDKFTVAAATGNTLVAGTLDVTGNIDPTTYETTNGGFLDEDNMASNAANKVASQQSIKAYIASKLDLSTYTPNDSESNAMLKAHAYKAATDGEVTASIITNADFQRIRGYIDDTSDPAGAGHLKDANQILSSGEIGGVSFLVAKDEYFEITTNSTNAPTIYWRSFGTKSNPVDYN